jgi:hypothetical protein
LLQKGGQVLGTSVSLAMVTGRAFRIVHVRAGRKRPGLLRQHLAAVRAAAEVAGARVVGDAIGSRELAFEPGEVRPGRYAFAVGTAGSATLVFQTVEIFRQLALPAVKRAIELATSVGIPTHVHSCGPEKALVKIMAEETNLTVIDPLEAPPMGDCDLAEMKRLYGEKIILKGNLRTTGVMLRGSPDDVRAAARRCIDAAAEGGGFILSTGDQLGRDTPDENLRAMVETARTYGRY